MFMFLKKSFLYVVINIFFLMLIISCSIFSSDSDFIPVNYKMKSVDIGISFPPSATSEQREFSIGHMNDLNMEWYRINQDWSNREPSNNEYNWAPLNSRLVDFTNGGKKVLLTLDMKNLPNWWVSLSDDATRVAEFKEFAKELLINFSEEIDLIQFGNEWNWEIDDSLGDYFSSYSENELDTLYINLSNALYEAVNEHIGTKPKVVLGSVSIGGLEAISYSVGSISNIKFENGDLYTENQLDEYDFNAIRVRVKNIITNINFDYVDFHLYDEYWNWSTYINDFKSLINETGKIANDYNFISGEFGGPHPYLEPQEEKFAANRLLEYVKALDQINLDFALYFKLVKDSSSGAAHPNSYLIDENLNTSYRYEQMKVIVKP